MLHACVQRFDVTKNLEKFCKILETKQAPSKHAVNLVGQVQAIQFSMPVPEWILFILAASTSSGPLVPA